MAQSVTAMSVGSYPAFPPLPAKQAVYFCCTFLRVASTGISPAPCPKKLGLSSSVKITAATVRTTQCAFYHIILSVSTRGDDCEEAFITVRLVPNFSSSFSFNMSHTITSLS